jgi:hypothetical protein
MGRIVKEGSRDSAISSIIKGTNELEGFFLGLAMRNHRRVEKTFQEENP